MTARPACPGAPYRFVLCLSAALVVAGWAVPSLSAQEWSSLEEARAALPELMGVERVRALADMTEAYRSTAPAEAVAFGERAVAVAESYPDPISEVKALTEMAWALMELGRYDEARVRAGEGLIRAQEGQVRRGVARAKNNLGVIARRTGDFPEALRCFREAMEVYRDIGDEAAVATSLNNLAVVLGFDVGDYQRAVENQLQALAIRERMGDEEGRYQSYNALGVIYSNMGDPGEAVRYLNLALEGWRSLGIQPRIAATLNNLAGVYEDIGELERALTLQRESLAIRQAVGTPSAIAFSLASIGTTLTRLGRLAEARDPLERSLVLRREMGEMKSEAQSLLGLARLELREGDPAEAERLVGEAMTIATAIEAPEEERDAWFELSSIREARGDAAGALEALREWDRLDDALFSEDRARRIEALESEFRQTRAQQEIERLSAEAELAGSLAEQRRTQMLVAILVALVAFLLYRRHVMGQVQRDLEQQVRERTSELSEANARLRALSLTDTLTGLPNRRYFFQSVESDVAMSLRAHRDSLASGAILESADLVFYVLDLDDFKSVNDEYGHAAGDNVLQQVANVLNDTGRASDLVVRWGGEEFLVVARQVDRRGAAAFAERIRQAIRSHLFAAGDGRMLHRTCSIGFAAYPLVPDEPQAVHWETVLGIADQAAYAAKRSGRDAWVGIECTERTVAEEVSGAREVIAAMVQEGTLSAIHSLEGRRSLVWEDGPARDGGAGEERAGTED